MRFSPLVFALALLSMPAACNHGDRYDDYCPLPDGPRRYSPSSSGESYNPIEENNYRSVERRPLSTFSIDVDTASYSNVRRFLFDGRLPPKDAVRIEEMINYFPYDYPQPDGNIPFSGIAEVADSPWANGQKLVFIGIQGRRIDREEAPPRNLVFLIDVSGSMDSPDKLPLVKDSLRMLTEDLTEDDRISIVVYAGAAGTALSPTSGDRTRTILNALDSLEAGGSTNGGDGIQRAYRIAQETFIRNGVNRVILATDGDFNVGVTGQDDLIRLIEEKRRSGVYLSVLGFGTGNLKDGTMEQLADHGNGHYAYIDSIDEARNIFARDFGTSMIPIAKDVKIQVEFNPRRVASYRLIGYENRLMRERDFRDDAKDAGDVGAGRAVTAIYEIIPAGRFAERRDQSEPLRYRRGEIPGDDELMTATIRYKPVFNPGSRRDEASEQVVFSVNDERRDFREASSSFRFAAAVAAFGMLLRDSRFGNATFDDIAEWADGALDFDPAGDRREFVRLVETAREISGGRRPGRGSSRKF